MGEKILAHLENLQNLGLFDLEFQHQQERRRYFAAHADREGGSVARPPLFSK
jgi:hypothetical protein